MTAERDALREALLTVKALCVPMPPPADHPIPEPLASVLTSIIEAALASPVQEGAEDA